MPLLANMWLPLILMVTMMGTAVPMESMNCVRHLDSHYIVNLTKNFHHIDFIAALVKRMRSEKVINEFSYAIIMQRVSQSTHGNCDLEVRHKRQAVAGGVLLFLGGALISPLLDHLLHPEYATQEELLKVNSFLTELAHYVNDLEQRVRYLERQSEILELMLGIITALEVEQEKFSELTSRDSYSASVRRLLKPVIERYEQMGILKKRRIIDLMEEKLPHATWKLSARMNADPNCTKASLQVAVYAAVPSKSCLEVTASAADYVILKKDDKCLILPPLTTFTLLKDGSYFSQANFFVSMDCDIARLNFTFSFNDGVFLASPNQNGTAIGDCGTVDIEHLHRNSGAAAQIGCSAYLSSNEQKPKISDLYSPRIRAWTLNKTELLRLEHDSFLYIDTDMMTLPDAKIATDELTTVELDEREKEGKNIAETVFIVVTIAALLVLASWLAWRGYNRIKPQRPPIARPSIVVLHEQKKDELERSQELINDLKNLIALKPLNLSTNSFSSSSSTEPRDAATTSVVQEAPGTSLALTPPVNARRVSA